MLPELKDYFYFTRGEKRGILVLSMLILFSLFIPEIYAWYTADREKQDIQSLLNENICYLSDIIVSDTDSMVKDAPVNHPGYEETQHDQPGKNHLKIAGIQGPVFDLNRADSLDLLSLPGIGPYFAKSIIRYREKLGGYISVNQVLEIYGMNQEKLNRIKSRLIADTSGLQKLKVNTADFKTIMKHPYCNYQIAKSLIKFRQQYGNITQFDELVKSGIIPDSLFHKILPYLSLN